MSNIELMSLSCASCGAKLDDISGKSEVECDYCENVTRIIRPVAVKQSQSIKKDAVETFTNLVQIMEQSMVAENYREAYDYCNKALEIDPSCGSIWENKAICSFWLRTDNKIIESQAKEVLTYLNAAKTNDPNSETYKETCDNIAFNLYYAAWYSYSLLQPDTPATKDADNTLYSDNLLKVMVSYFNMMEVAFDLSPTQLYLEQNIKELSNLGQVVWIKIDSKKELTNRVKPADIGLNAIKARERFIKKIKNINPNYTAPEIKKTGCFIATVTMGNYNDPVVYQLRRFRDEWILKKSWGNNFVIWYYKYGKICADYIEDKYLLKKISFLFVVKPLYFISKFFIKK